MKISNHSKPLLTLIFIFSVVISSFPSLASVKVFMCSGDDWGTNWDQCTEITISQATDEIRIDTKGFNFTDYAVREQLNKTIGGSSWKNYIEYIINAEHESGDPPVVELYIDSWGWHAGGDYPPKGCNDTRFSNLHGTYTIGYISKGSVRYFHGSKHAFIPPKAGSYCITKGQFKR